jgi:hypothetical protein
MTVERGRSWGERRPRPPDLVEVADDAAAGALINQLRAAGQPLPPIGLRAGDLRRTLGGDGGGRVRAPLDGPELGCYPVDLGVAVFGGRPRWFLSHLVARRSWWWGEVVAVMNAELIGPWDVAPRSHPNDGRLDVVRTSDLGLGDRWKARRRLRTGTHTPHPRITTARADELELAFAHPLTIRLDGVKVGRATELHVHVEPDALVVCI